MTDGDEERSSRPTDLAGREQPRDDDGGVSDVDMDMEFEYDEELEQALQAAESQTIPTNPNTNTNDGGNGEMPVQVDMEDLGRPSASLRPRSDDPNLPLPPSTAEEVGVTATDKEDANEQAKDEEAEEEEAEDRRSPFERFRKKGFLSVSDLVGPIWCETQYDYRLRTLPFLPPSQRPEVIRSTAGKEIVVDKLKVEGKERILRRGEKIHKRLEREIHPQEVVVTTTTREDDWGLRFLNMLSAVEALLTLGKCRELPVVGFTNGIMVMGIIDEVTRQPLPDQQTKPDTRSKRQTQNQTALTSFFASSKPKVSERPVKARTHRLFVSDSKTRASGSLPREGDTLAGRLQVMMYKEMLDAILLAASPPSSDTVPSSSSSSSQLVGVDSTATSTATSSAYARSNLPSRNPFAWTDVFSHLHLDPSSSFSDDFLAQSRAIVAGNGLRFGAADAKCLNDMCHVWRTYVEQLGLGTPTPPPPPSLSTPSGKIRSSPRKGKGKEKDKEDKNAGKTEDLLELVYRRAGPVEKPKDGTTKRDRPNGRRRKRRRDTINDIIAQDVDGEPPPPAFSEIKVDYDNDSAKTMTSTMEDEEERLIQLAIAESLNSRSQSYLFPSQSAISAAAEVTRPSRDRSGTIGEPSASAPPDRPSTRASERAYCARGERNSEDEKEEDELAWAVEMSLVSMAEKEVEDQVGVKVVSTSQRSPTVGHEGVDSLPPCSLSASASASGEVDMAQSKSNSTDTRPDEAARPTSPNYSDDDNDTDIGALPTTELGVSVSVSDSKGKGKSSGSIIGRTRFAHSSLLLSKHIESVLGFWMGQREPTGVDIEDARRCGWCEFEEGCEWRQKKAEEIWKNKQRA